MSRSRLSFRRQRLGTVFDAALVQLGWWACVLGAANGFFWAGPLIVALLLAVQIAGLPAEARRWAWRSALVAGVLGTAVDSLQSGLGLMTLHGSTVPWLAPLWITVLWCQFVTVLPAFAALRSRPLLAGLLGAVGGPLAYGGGVRLGAGSLHPEPWVSLVSVGVVWALALPLMLRFFLESEESSERRILTAPGSARALES